MFVISPLEGAGVAPGVATRNHDDGAQDEESLSDERRLPCLFEKTHQQRVQVCLSV